MGLQTTRLWGCSRTDAGVHALGQLASLSSRTHIPPQGWIHGLNTALPPDVVVLDAQPCDPRYNPRFYARSKLYRYLVRCGRYRDPLSRILSWHLLPNYGRTGVLSRQDLVEDYLDLEAMRQAARHLIGTHDFNAFRAASDGRATSERTLFAVRVLPGWSGQRDLLAIEVCGSAFLKHMVRIIVGTLVDVGRGHRDADDMVKMLRRGAVRSDAGPTAPPQGLTLVEIELDRYDGPLDSIGRPTQIEPPKRPHSVQSV